MPRLILIARTVASILLALSMWTSPLQAQASRPNIVLMFPDNLGWGEVGAYGARARRADA